MEIIEKQIEKVKEVPADSYNCHYGYPYSGGWGRNINGKANAGLTTGIIGTALGAAALASRNRGFNLFGNGSNGTLDGANININGMPYGNSYTSPSAFQAWEKGCEDTLALQKGLYDWALNQQSQRFADRQTLDSELFGVYKANVDSSFSLYKGYRDADDAIKDSMVANNFALYKNQRDNFDTLSQRISDLETKQAVADAVEPWRAKVLDMRINGVAANACAGIALEAERRCCADNKIVNYLNSNFYPINVADVTVGTTSTARTLSNPLCGCCNGNCNHMNF